MSKSAPSENKTPITLFTIGFAGKSAEEFFTALRAAGVERLIDVRLNNVSQLAGFTKRRDLECFLKVIAGIDEWRSLQLVHPPAVHFQRDPHHAQRWRAVFEHGRTSYSLPVTDPLCTAKLDARAPVGPDCLLTVSLGGPWAPRDGGRPEACYKLVAAAIDLRRERDFH
jgi:hypothetical protein